MDPTLIAFMLGISIILGLFGLLFFIWALRGGQFDDE
ncbi:MAG: cbb3-type cytochrome oxidase assembly protein CcoS, partial [Campylobacterales bacterium]